VSVLLVAPSNTDGRISIIEARTVAVVPQCLCLFILILICCFLDVVLCKNHRGLKNVPYSALSIVDGRHTHLNTLAHIFKLETSLLGAAPEDNEK